jgi:hypothetical protein
MRTEPEKSGKREWCRSEKRQRRAGRGIGADQKTDREEREAGVVKIRTVLDKIGKW